MRTTEVAEPLRGWDRITLGLVVLIAVAAVGGALLAALYLVLGSTVADGNVATMPDWLRGVLRHAALIDTVYLGTTLAYLGALVWWRGRTRTLLVIFGNGNLGPLSNKLLRIWMVFLFLAVYLRFQANQETMLTVDGMTSRLQLTSAACAIRVVALLVLLLAVWQVRTQVWATIRSGLPAPVELYPTR